MIPTFWLTIQVKGRRIPILLPLISPLALVIEILAIPATAIYAICKKQYLPLRFVSRFYLTRFILAFIVHGRNFKINVCEGDNRVRIGGSIRKNKI